MTRYVQDEKAFLLPHLDMHRYAVKNAQKHGSGLDGVRREVYERLVDTLFAAVDWRMLNAHVRDSLTKNNLRIANGNIYDLNERISKIVRKMSQWVRRNRNFNSDKLTEFLQNMVKIGRSICRVLAEAATCWSRDAERIVVADVRS